MQYQYYTVDVFTSEPFSGAQITVFPQAEGLNERQMQLLAREMNHSETVFVFSDEQPDCTAGLRVFSPQGEKDFGSHTTVAAAYTLAHSGALSMPAVNEPVYFRQGGQRLQVHMRGAEQNLSAQLSLSVAPVFDRYVPDSGELQSILQLAEDDIERIKSGPLFVCCTTSYLVVPLRSLDALYRASHQAEAWAQSSVSSIPVQELLLYCQDTEASAADFHLRLVGPLIGERDDPPVGAAIPAFAAYLRETRKLAAGTHALCVERGLRETRQSLLQVEFDLKPSAPLNIRVGGDAVLVGQGLIRAPAA